jgi:hypothetical protein
MVYKWESYKYSVPAEVVGAEFEKIEKEHGKVTSEFVLDSARDTDSPLHSMFEWNNEIAGEKYRLHQATIIILSLKVEKETEEKPKTLRAYYNVSESEKKGSFINVDSAFSNPDTQEIILKRALREFQAFRTKYENLKEFAKVFKEFDEVFTSLIDEE